MKAILYISLLTFILILSNYIYIQCGFYKLDIKKCDANLMQILDSALNKKNILYFGESSNFTFSETDTCKKSICTLVQDFDTAYRIAPITKGAIHAGTYNYLTHRLKDNSTIRAIIITVNLRSFGINWIQSDLETNISRANILYLNYPPIVKKLLLDFKAYDNLAVFKRKEIIKEHYKRDRFKLLSKNFETVRDWDATVFDKGISDASGNKDQQKTDLACHFIKNFAFRLAEGNPRVKDLDEIVTFCKEKNIQLIFNLLPENYEKIRELCGIDLEILMRSNVLFLKNRYQQSVSFIDNFYLVKDSCFIDRSWPTEHYSYPGRKAVSDKINAKLKTIFYN